MSYSKSLNYISLATATLLLSSQNAKSDVYEGLRHANEIYKSLKENPNNWREAAKCFVNVFDEFSQGIFDILDEYGGEPMYGTFISTELWKMGRTFPKAKASVSSTYRVALSARSYLKNETIEDISYCGPSFWHSQCWKTGDSACECCIFNPITDLLCCLPTCGILPLIHGIFCCCSERDEWNFYYFLDNVEPSLKQYILHSLKVDSLKKAGFYWEKNFVIPVSQLLIDHASEMKQDAETLQLVLDLYRCYHRCDFICARGLDDTFSLLKVFTDSSACLKNFKKVYQRVYDELTEAILTCNTPGEYENILCGLLLQEDGKTKIGDEYYKGTWEYGLVIEHLVESLNKQIAISKRQVSEAIGNAIQIAEKTYQNLQRRQQNQEIIETAQEAGFEMGYAARRAAGL